MSIKIEGGATMGGIEYLLKRKPAENQRASNLLAERQDYEPALLYPWNSIRFQNVNALGGTT